MKTLRISALAAGIALVAAACSFGGGTKPMPTVTITLRLAPTLTLAPAPSASSTPTTGTSTPSKTEVAEAGKMPSGWKLDELRSGTPLAYVKAAVSAFLKLDGNQGDKPKIIEVSAVQCDQSGTSAAPSWGIAFCGGDIFVHRELSREQGIVAPAAVVLAYADYVTVFSNGGSISYEKAGCKAGQVTMLLIRSNLISDDAKVRISGALEVDRTPSVVGSKVAENYDRGLVEQGCP